MKTVNINGIEYVQKKELDNLKKRVSKKSFTKEDLDEIKAKVMKTFDDFEDASTSMPQRGRGKNSNVVFKPSPTSQTLIDVHGVNDKGKFILKRGNTSKYTIRDVKFLKSHINKRTTHEDVRNLSKVLGLRREMVRKLIYNINEGTFDDYI